MALAKVETTVMELVAEQEQAEKRMQALAPVEVVEPATAHTVAVVAAAAAPSASAVGDTIAFLQASGFGNLKLDFTSFPTVSLNNHVFSTSEHKAFGTEFEFRYLDHRETFLFKADYGREAEPRLIYSDDGLFDNRVDDEGKAKPMAAWIEEWKADPKVVGTERKLYTMVIGKMVGSVHDGEIVQLQISPGSAGKLHGYVYNLASDGLTLQQVITKVGICPEVGSGIKAFTPWKFSKV